MVSQPPSAFGHKLSTVQRRLQSFIYMAGEYIQIRERSAWRPRPLFEAIGCVLLFVCLVFPIVRPLLEIKAGLFLVLLLATSLDALLAGRIKVHLSIARWSLGLALVGMLFSLEGIAFGAPGAISYGVGIYVFWPLVYAFLLGGARNENILKCLYWIAVASTIFIALNGILFVLSQLGLVEQFDWSSILGVDEEDAIQGYGLTEGYIKINVVGINSMPFLVPMVISGAIFLEARGRFRVVQRIAIYAALLLGLVFVFVTGRRALLLVTLLCPVILIPFVLARGTVGIGQRLRIISAGLIVGGIVFASSSYLNSSAGDPFSLASVWDILSSAFKLSDSSNVNELVRREQLFSLLNGWSERPLTGWGLGASGKIFGPLSSEQYPWAYELYYNALLFQVGLLGFMAYLAGVVWIYLMGWRVIRSKHPVSNLMTPFLVAMTCYLIASGTNPYLPRFDGLWVFFLPVACINWWLCDRGRSIATATAG
jgi:hypothetical protein